ncbi:probable mediator of RNA polymerase II transcription subunit 26c isoform X3 [Salvia splendens]|uniref:probable mediator of RNA polymerase II transcription subunit 26c isoform X3 n=1 Tax=Salvia splendens TaxID=180675 RepID=UPI001C25EA42|nr:probable mediator of RNA polymerase II transcription subunit 26c isoform X3 [Salvia splendens]
MNPEEFRAILSRSGTEIWALIRAAICVAGSDYGDELRRRRDELVELLYAPEAQMCRNCSGDIRRRVVDHEPYFPENICINNFNSSDNVDNSSIKFDVDDEHKKFSKIVRDSNDDFAKSPLTPESNLSGGEEEDGDAYGGLFDDEQTKIFSIKEQLEDLNQSEDTVVDLLQNLADMDITFHALKDTDIGRHVNRLRKHSSNEVRRLVKQLVRKWKETVDEWVKVNQPQATSNLIADGDSPQQSIPRNQQNGHHQRAQREPVMDDEKLNSARKRLQENYQEAKNAKKQRTIQVMDIHDIPKPKNGFIAKNKGSLAGRHNR